MMTIKSDKTGQAEYDRLLDNGKDVLKIWI